jgi:hypothetical protein
MSVETSELLKGVHRAVGVPGHLTEVPPRRRALLAAAVQSYGAAAACSGLTAWLLLAERDAAAERIGEIVRPRVSVPGVTSLDAAPRSTWRATVRASAAASAELLEARAGWTGVADDAGEAAIAAIDRLLNYVDEIALVLEKSEPPPTSA